jgi:hypothetical protein
MLLSGSFGRPKRLKEPELFSGQNMHHYFCGQKTTHSNVSRGLFHVPKPMHARIDRISGKIDGRHAPAHSRLGPCQIPMNEAMNDR